MKNFTQHKTFSIKWVAILLGIVFLLPKQEVQSQVISNIGAYISISDGTVVVTDTINNDNPTTLVNAGTITLHTLNNAGTTYGGGSFNIAGNLINTGTFIQNSGTVTFDGTSAQTLDGATFYNLTVNNSNGVTMLGDATVASALNLSTGKLKIGANTLILNGAAIRVSGKLEGSHASSLIIAGTAGSLFFDNASTNNYLKNLIINTGASATFGDSLNITGGAAANQAGALTINGSGVLTTGGFLTIKSNEFGTARIAANTSGANYISGVVTVERYIPQNNNRAWRLLTATAFGQTIKTAWQENQSAGVVGVAGFGTQITSPLANAVSFGFDAVSQSASMYRFDSSANVLRAIINTQDSLIAAHQGYFLYIRGDRTQSVSSSTTNLNATTLRTKGLLYMGTRNTPVVANKSALVGNPFPSAIDLGLVNFTGTASATTFRVWDPKLNTVGGFQTFSKPVYDDYVVTPGGGSYGPSGSIVNTIESGQAFFISGGSSGGDISITENSKISGSNLVFKPLDNNYPALFTNIYSVATTGNRMVDGTFVAMDERYSNLVDDYDGLKQNNFNENFALLRDGVKLAVEKRKPFTVNDTVFYNMYQMRPNNYQLAFKSQQIDPSLVAILEDTYLNNRTPVTINGNTTYNFTIDANAGSFASNRFRLVFGPMGGALPVTFTNVNATDLNGNIAIRWIVGDQQNLSGYEVEKSVDGRSFSKVATQAVGPNTNASYNWLDINATEGSNFYRIKAIDISGAVKYSNIVKVVLGKKSGGFTISPNPIKGNTISLRFVNQPAGNYTIRLTNTIGQVLYSRVQAHTVGSAEHSYTLNGNMASGVYQLHVLAPNKTKQVQKLIIDAGN